MSKPRGGGRLLPTPATLLLALSCAAAASALAPAATRRAVALTPSAAQTEAEEAASVAREALARLPPEERLAGIRNERLRRSVQAAYRAVVELAENGDPSKVSAINAKFERAYAGVEREARAARAVCVENCVACDGEPCRAKCKSAGRRFCGCKLVVFGCVVAECLF